MAAPGFGFSVGDFIVGVTLVRKLIRALDDSAGARTSYRQLVSGLSDLDEALTAVSNLQLDLTEPAQKIALEQVASKCQLSIMTFLKQNSKFKGSLGITSGQPNSTPARWRASLHKIQWALCKDSAIQALRTEIRAHTVTLNLLLSTIQTASANLQKQATDNCTNLVQETQVQSGETMALVKQNHQLLTFQADQIASISSTVAKFVDSHQAGATEADDLRSLYTKVMESNIKISTTVLHMHQILSNLPAQVDRQQPIVFEDAHGRLVPFHVEFINSFAVFQAVLEARFRDVPGLRKVKSLEYAMQDVASRRKIDLAGSWESIFRPGRRVNMSMVFQQDQAQSSSCPGCFTENAVVGDDTKDDVQCSNTFCGMWYRRITGPEAATSNIEAEPHDESAIEEMDAIDDFRRVQILHPPMMVKSELKQGIRPERSELKQGIRPKKSVVTLGIRPKKSAVTLGIRPQRSSRAYATSDSSSGDTWVTARAYGTDTSSTGSMWSTQQPVQSADTKTWINSKGQFVTVINHKQQNRQDEPSPTYKSAKKMANKHEPASTGTKLHTV